MWESLKKFGPDYYDLPTMLSNVSAMLRMLVLNIDGRDSRRIPIIYILLTSISSVLYIYGYVFSGFWFAFWHALEIGEVSGAFVEFSLNVNSQVAIVKLFYLQLFFFCFVYREKLRVLTNKYIDLDARIPKDSRYSKNLQKNLKQVKIRGIIYWTILMVDAGVYMVKPFLTADTFVIYALEPMMESPNYEIATVIMNIDIFFICYTVANVTCFLILIIGYIEAQMLALSEEIIHIYDDAVEHYKKVSALAGDSYSGNYRKDIETKIINQYIKEHLSDIVVDHANNISSLQEIEEVMRGPNAVGFLYLILGLTAELLGGLEVTWLQLPFTMLQLSVDCYLGQKIKDSSDKFEESVYDCKWEKFNVSNMNSTSVCSENYDGGGMAILNFCCLMSIIKTTYSAYTTLRWFK